MQMVRNNEENLTSLIIDDGSMSKEFIVELLLALNQKTIKKIILNSRLDIDNVAFEIISNMVNLQYLHLNCEQFNASQHCTEFLKYGIIKMTNLR